MKVFYFCQTGVHTALVAANIHLGNLSTEDVPTADELTALEHFDSKIKNQIGEVVFVGQDSFDNEVYSIGVFSEKDLGPRSIKSLLSIYNVDSDDFKFVNMLDCTDAIIKVGLTIEFLFGKNFISDQLTIRGLQKNYKKIVQTVKSQNLSSQ